MTVHQREPKDTGHPWARTAAEVLAALSATPSGLPGGEAARRLQAGGPNRLPEPPRPSALVRLARQFNNLLILILLCAAAITTLLAHWVDTGVILAVVVANTAIGFMQEGRAEKAVEALREMLALKAAALRDGQRVMVDAANLVPGDIVLIEAGDKVPADLRLIEAAGLAVEEAILTGESVPATKAIGPVAPNAALGDRRSMAFSGTLVSEGIGTGVVVATGAATEIGRISGLMATVEPLTTPLVAQMDRVAKVLTAVALAMAAIVLMLTTLVRDMPFAESFMIVVGLFVAAIPEGLPTILTVTLAIGVHAMARRNAIIRRLPAIETIGAVSTICTDKTGTLTRNEMTVTTVATADGVYAVTGNGYQPQGTVCLGGIIVEPTNALKAFGSIASLCNTAELKETPKGWSVHGDPMEGALLAAGAKLGIARDGRPQALSTIPFDTRYRYMAVVQDLPEGRFVLVKGAPEQMFDRCAAEMAGDGQRPFDRVAWEARADAIAAQGQRVLAFARKPHRPAEIGHEDLSDGLTFVGLAGLIDPPRDEAIAAVAECRAAGIAVKMITGDHKGTASSIGNQIGLDNPGRVLTGAELDLLDDEALRREARVTSIFARTSPEHKLRLVEALQADGAVVAMTGDGVNDAPALKRADAGIAMGLKGSQAAREASDLVLADDNFASIAEAVRQGRTVYANLKKVIAFMLPVNGGESASLMLAVILGLTLPVTPLQILWINMVSSVVLATALAFEGPEAAIMRQPPRRRDLPILSRFIVWRIVFVSLLHAVGIFGQFELAQWQGADLETARTMALNTLVAMEIFYLFSVRYRLGWSITWEGVKGTPAVLLAVGLVLLLQAAFTYLPVMNALFDTRSLTVWQLAQCASAGIVLLVILDIDKRLAGLWKSGARS